MNLYLWAKKHIAGFLRRLLRVRDTGAENEPQTGGLIVCSNHTSMLDVIVLAIVLRRQLRYLAKAELFRVPLLSAVIRSCGAYSVDRGGSDVAAIKKTISLLREGESVGIFPQGHRYRGVSPRGTEIHYGVGMAAYHSQAAVLPVFIRTKNYKMRLFGRKEVVVGRPLTFEELAFTGGSTAEYRRASELIFSRILALEEGGQ